MEESAGSWWVTFSADHSAANRRSGGASNIPVSVRSENQSGVRVSHTLRTLSEMDEATTILSVDGVGAFDLISRNAMLGLDEMLGGLEVSDVLRPVHPGSSGRTRSGT